MRIWIIHQNAYAPFHSAGTRHFALSRQLMRRGHEVLIIASSFYHKTREETRLEHGELFRRETIEGVPFLWVRAPAYRHSNAFRVWNMSVFAWRVWRTTGLFGEPKPDVILGSSPPLFAAYAAERLATRWKIPFILELRDVWPETLVQLGGITPHHPFIQLLGRIERHLYRRASAIVSLLPAIHSHLAAHGGGEKPIIWLSNGVDPQRIPPPSDPPLRDTFTVIYAGAHGLSNSLETILHCAQLVQRDPRGNGVRFRFIGDGPEKGRLQNLAHRLELTNVCFEPSIVKSRIYEELAQADAFVAALRNSNLYRHGQSMNKLYDYMAVGRPTVLAAPPMIEPISEENAGIVVSAENPASMANAVLQLRQMTDQQRRRFGMCGRNAVIQKYNFEHLSIELENLLHLVVADHQASNRSAAAKSVLNV